MPSDSFFEIWCVNSKIFHWLSIISVSRSFCWPYTPANSKDFIPVAKNEILFHLGIDKSEAKTFLGLLNLEKSPSTKLNNSCHVISSLDQQMSFKNATSTSSWPVQAYFPCAGLVKHLKIISRGWHERWSAHFRELAFLLFACMHFLIIGEGPIVCKSVWSALCKTSLSDLQTYL